LIVNDCYWRLLLSFYKLHSSDKMFKKNLSVMVLMSHFIIACVSFTIIDKITSQKQLTETFWALHLSSLQCSLQHWKWFTTPEVDCTLPNQIIYFWGLLKYYMACVFVNCAC